MSSRIERRRFSKLATALAAAGALVAQPIANAAPAQGSASLPAVGTVTRTMMRPGSAQPAVVVGVLSAPSGERPEAIASRYLRSAPAVLAGADAASLEVADVRAFRRGHAVRYQQKHRGLEVIGGDTVVRTDERGRIRWAASSARQIPADLVVTPSMPAVMALREVGRRAGYVDADLANVDVARQSRLVIYAQPNMEPRLAWWIELPQDLLRMQTIRAFVDAHTGTVYRSENLMRHAAPTCPDATQLAYVYDVNPTETDLSCQSLAGTLDPEAENLANADVALANCIDNKNCSEFTVPGFGMFNIHFCDQVPVAVPDEAGDFLAYEFVSDTEPEDGFAEVQMFYHVNKVYDKARALGGFTDLNQKPLKAVVNFRMPAFDFGSICQGQTYTGTGTLQPFDNAMFASAGTLGSFPAEDSIVFGQGTTRDFAYDGDVVYHEFGHALMATVAPQLAFGFIDQYGFNSMPGGMHEGYADLLTMFVTDDPEIGEYAGAGLAGPNATAIRNIENEASCPKDLLGQSHQDSLPITGAMWEARKAVATTPEDKTKFDQAIFNAQQTFGAFDDFHGAATKTLAEIETLFDKSTADAVEAIFTDRGMMGCNNRIVDGGKPLMFVTGTDQAQVSQLPAFVQFKYELPEDATELVVKIAASQSGGFGGGGLGGGTPTASMKVVAKGGGEPILWTATGSISGDYEAEGTVTFGTGQNAGGEARIKGGFPAGTYHLQIVNQGPTWVLQQVSVSHTAGDITPDAGPDDMQPDAGPGGGADTDEGGCGCLAGPDRASGLGAFALFLLCALVLRRRRA